MKISVCPNDLVKSWDARLNLVNLLISRIKMQNCQIVMIMIFFYFI